MRNIEKALSMCYKPWDLVGDKNGSIGFIQEVNINECQENIENQISYSVVWVVGMQNKTAWFNHFELIKYCNVFQEIAKASCRDSFQNKEFVSKIMGL